MDYRSIYGTQLFQQSQCIWHENALVDMLRSLLTLQGYEPVDDRRYVWDRSGRRVYLAIVDDLEHLNLEQVEDFFGSLTKDSTVITDNWFSRPMEATVLTLPMSWFGIYASRPEIHHAIPKKSWCMPVNRIDYNRTMVMLEMHHRGHITSDSCVNFNCARHTDQQGSQDQRDLWLSNWQNIDGHYQEKYQSSFDNLTPLMPFSNHQYDFDRMIEISKVQIVLETYVSDHSVAFSEKTFRALVTPRLWRLFAGTWAVARLRHMGFDVLDDVIDHDTDGIRMVEDKIPRFVKSCQQTWTTRHWGDVEKSCHRAQAHNMALLERWRQQWPGDLSHWLVGVADHVR